MVNRGNVLVAGVAAGQTEEAIRELLMKLKADSAALTMVFFSPEHDAKIVARVLDEVTGSRGVGGTTAGEIWGSGFREASMTGISFSGEGVRATVSIIAQLRNLSLVPLSHLPQTMARRIGRNPEELTTKHHLWLTLFDGLSESEELVAPFFRQAAGAAALVGGSLADGSDFEQVSLVHHGRVYQDTAAVALLEYGPGFACFRSTHIRFSDQWMTVTRLGDSPRVVEELDGQPALEVLARKMGMPGQKLDVSSLSGVALGFRFRGRPFPYSVSEILEDGALRLGNSLQLGDRLNLLQPGDLVATTREAVKRAAQGLGKEVQASLLFHCLSRSQEARSKGLVEELFEAINIAPTCGLNTYGEQFSAMHLNHHLIGVLFG